MKPNGLLLFLFPVLLFSCVSSKQYKLLQGRYNSLDSSNASLRSDLKGCEDRNAEAARQKGLQDAEIAKLNSQIGLLKENKTALFLIYLTVSVVGGLLATFIGIRIAK